MNDWHSEELGELASALAKAQAQIAPAVKGAKNPHLNSTYADLAAVWDACRKPLSENGLSVVQLPQMDADAIHVRTVLMHVSGQWVSSELGIRLADAKGLTPVQAMGSAITYLRRYMLSAIAGVAPGDDDDGSAPGIALAARTPAAQQAAQPVRTAPAPKQPKKCTVCGAPKVTPALEAICDRQKLPLMCGACGRAHLAAQKAQVAAPKADYRETENPLPEEPDICEGCGERVLPEYAAQCRETKRDIVCPTCLDAMDGERE